MQEAGCEGKPWTLRKNGKQSGAWVSVNVPLGAGDRVQRTIAIIVAQTPRYEQTGYANGNRLDLRLCNLMQKGRWKPKATD